MSSAQRVGRLSDISLDSKDQEGDIDPKFVLSTANESNRLQVDPIVTALKIGVENNSKTRYSKLLTLEPKNGIGPSFVMNFNLFESLSKQTNKAEDLLKASLISPLTDTTLDMANQTQEKTITELVTEKSSDDDYQETLLDSADPVQSIVEAINLSSDLEQIETTLDDIAFPQVDIVLHDTNIDDSFSVTLKDMNKSLHDSHRLTSSKDKEPSEETSRSTSPDETEESKSPDSEDIMYSLFNPNPNEYSAPIVGCKFFNAGQSDKTLNNATIQISQVEGQQDLESKEKLKPIRKTDKPLIFKRNKKITPLDQSVSNKVIIDFQIPESVYSGDDDGDMDDETQVAIEKLTQIAIQSAKGNKSKEGDKSHFLSQHQEPNEMDDSQIKRLNLEPNTLPCVSNDPNNRITFTASHLKLIDDLMTQINTNSTNIQTLKQQQDNNMASVLDQTLSATDNLNELFNHLINRVQYLENELEMIKKHVNLKEVSERRFNTILENPENENKRSDQVVSEKTQNREVKRSFFQRSLPISADHQPKTMAPRFTPPSKRIIEDSGPSVFGMKPNIKKGGKNHSASSPFPAQQRKKDNISEDTQDDLQPKKVVYGLRDPNLTVRNTQKIEKVNLNPFKPTLSNTSSVEEKQVEQKPDGIVALFKDIRILTTIAVQSDNSELMRKLSQVVFQIFQKVYPENDEYSTGDTRANNYCVTEKITIDSMMIDLARGGSTFDLSKASLTTLNSMMTTFKNMYLSK